MTTTEVQAVFDVLRPALTELVASRAAGRRVVPRTATSRSTRSARSPSGSCATLGFEEGAWRLDPTAHPFCTSFSNRDVRLTTRYRPDDLESRLVDACTRRATGSTRTGSPTSLAAHAARTARRRSGSTSRRAAPGRTSSAARGRSGTHWYEPLQEAFPTARATSSSTTFVRAINRAEPGPDPRRRRRDDVQPPHHPPLRARAGADRRARSRSRTCPRSGTRG